MERILMIDFTKLADKLITTLADNDVTFQNLSTSRSSDGKVTVSIVKEVVKKAAIRALSKELLIDKDLLPSDIEVTTANDGIDWDVTSKSTRLLISGNTYNVIRCDNRGYVSDKAVVMRIIARR